MSPGGSFDFNLDVMDVLARQGGSGVRYGLVAIDNFTEIAEVIPIKNKEPAELIRGLKLIFQSMGIPKQLYSDEEGGLKSKGFYRFVNENNIKTIQTSTHAHTVERFIRTCLDNLYRILNGLNQDNNEWTKHVDNIINKYNNTEHNTTKIKPSDAVKKENHLWVNWHLQNNAKQRQEIP